MNVPEGTATCGEPMLEQKKRMSAKEHQRESAKYCVTPFPCTAQGSDQRN